MDTKMKCTAKKYLNIVRTLFIVLSLFSSFSVAHALENERLVESIDIAFLRQSRSELSRVLEQTQTAPLYSDVETYVIKKIREALIFNRLEFAHFASLSLININLDNFEALDLYTRIGKALDAREAKHKQEEEVRLAQLEVEKKQADPIRENFEPEFEQRVSAEGQNIYFDLSELERYSPFNWGVNAKLMSLSLLSNPFEKGLKYGFGLSGEVFYIASAVTIGAELDISSHVITLSGNENFVTEFNIIPAISFNDFSENIFLRIGFKGILDDAVDTDNNDSQFFTPTLGLGWRNINIGNTQSRLCFDYLVGHVSLPDVKTAFDLGLRTIIPISEQDSFNINALFDVSNTLMIIGNDINNNLKISIGIGVGNYE